MNLIAIDTSTEACTVALCVGDEIVERFEVAPRQHLQRVLPMLESLLADAELSITQCDAIAFGRGPGSFTGVRIAASMVQALAFATDLPVIPVSTLQTLAQGCFRLHQDECVLVANDARIHEVYWGCYALEAGIMQCVGQEQLSAPDAMRYNLKQEYAACGTGFAEYTDEIQESILKGATAIYQEGFPHARDLVIIAKHEYHHGRIYKAEEALPVYLRDKVAEKMA